MSKGLREFSTVSSDKVRYLLRCYGVGKLGHPEYILILYFH